MKKAFKAITKLYDKVDFKETAIALDPNKKRQYLQKGRTGKLPKRTC
jgi:hypothetical protein